MVPPPWVEMILMFEKRFLAPVATMLAIMRVGIEHELENGWVQPIEQRLRCLRERGMDKQGRSAPVQLLEPRIELRLAKIDIADAR